MGGGERGDIRNVLPIIKGNIIGDFSNASRTVADNVVGEMEGDIGSSGFVLQEYLRLCCKTVLSLSAELQREQFEKTELHVKLCPSGPERVQSTNDLK